MKLQSSLAAAALFMMVSTCCGHIGGGLSVQDIGPQVYCGRNLAKVLAFLCYDNPAEKRSQTGTMYNAILAPYYKEQEAQPAWPWISHHHARTMSLPSRGKRFVVTECCDKPCSVSELLSYC